MKEESCFEFNLQSHIDRSKESLIEMNFTIQPFNTRLYNTVSQS